MAQNRDGIRENGMAEVNGGIVVHARTVLYTFSTGAETVTCIHAAATYSGDISGPADETFVAVDHADGSQTHYGWGRFSGQVKGDEGTLQWKFKGKPGSGDMEVYAGTGAIGNLRGAIRYVIDEGSRDTFTYQGDIA